MCKQFQQDSGTEEGRYKLFLYPRGTFKTSILTIGGAIFEIINNPNVRILISNATLDNAKAILHGIKSHFIFNNFFRFLFPELCPLFNRGAVKDMGTQTEFTVFGRTPNLKEATVEVGSVEGNLVSRHYDIHIGDDIVNDKNTATKDQIDKVDQFLKSITPLLEPGHSKNYLVGTTWHYDDIYSRIINDPDSPYKVYRRSILEPDAETGELKSIFDKRFTVKEIQAMRRSMGDSFFAAQMLNQPVMDEAMTFRPEWMHNYAEAPKGLYVITCIDPAISSAATADYTGMVTIGVGPDDETYVLEAKRARLNPLQLIEEIFRIYNQWKPAKLGIEVVAYQKAIKFFTIEEMKRRKQYIPLVEVKYDTVRTKEQRIMALQPRVQYCKFHIKDTMTELRDEMFRFPKAKHDDLLDALAMTEQLRKTPGRIRIQEQKSGITFEDAMNSIRNRNQLGSRIGGHRSFLSPSLPRVRMNE